MWQVLGREGNDPGRKVFFKLSRDTACVLSESDDLRMLAGSEF